MAVGPVRQDPIRENGMKEQRIPRDVLDETVRRVVDVARPERIILFGSATRGEEEHAGERSALRGPMGDQRDEILVVARNQNATVLLRVKEHFRIVRPCHSKQKDVPHVDVHAEQCITDTGRARVRREGS